MAHFRGNNFAKAAIDAAVWDIYGKMLGKPCRQLLGGTRTEVEVGPSFGIKKEPSMLVRAVGENLPKDSAGLNQSFTRFRYALY